MSTLAHCAYCFESLSASLEKRKPLTLDEVEVLWDKYNSASDDIQDEDFHENVEDDDIDEEMADETQSGTQQYLKPAAISRLLVPSPSTSSSSIPSANSSTPSLLRTEASSETSKSSSRSSFFSLNRSSKKDGKGGRTTVEEYPLFVTWNTVSKSGSRRLRGCIGTFEAQELDEGLKSYALTSAFDDCRFMPITLRELASLECGVTLLTSFKPVSDPMDWEIGKHGLRISFTYHGRRYGATYLPDVAREQGWTKEETMVSLMRKAGWTGRKEDWRKVGDLNVITYQGNIISLQHREWREWRDWVDQQKDGRSR